MTTPDPILEAAAQALYSLSPSDMQKPLDQRHDGDAEHTEAAAVRAAIYPLIEAEVREQVAREIEEERERLERWSSIWSRPFAHCARIARGGAQ